MKKAIAFLFLLLLIVLFVGVVIFFRGAPQLTPEPLKPVLSWVDDKQEVVTKQMAQWQSRLSGEPSPVVASDSVSSSEPLTQVTLGSNSVSTVTVDQDGKVAIKPGDAVASSNTESGELSDGLDGSVTQSSAELDAIARADAAIAAADAALAKAQGNPVAAAAKLVPRPIVVDSTSGAPASAAPSSKPPAVAAVAKPVQPAAPLSATANAGGSALGGATIALAQATRPLTPTEPTVLAAIPAPTIIAPDAPAPTPAASEAGRAQQAIIENFLAGEVVEFETGRDVLTVKGRRALQALLGIIEQNDQSVITIQGHTDSIGDERSNLELSTSRAIAARSYLIRRGVAANRLLVQGFGERKPISSNRNAAGRERNRRIDFAISDR